MALIVEQHSVVDMFDVDPDYSISSTGTIPAGTLVGLDADGYVTKVLATTYNTGIQPLGIAGDSLSDEYKTTAYSYDLVISPSGARRWTSNRVSDYFNEVLASGKMTVYIGSGVFFTDQYDTTVTFSNATRGIRLYPTTAGKWTSTANTARCVGFMLAAPTDYPSGVPGVDSPDVENSMSLGAFLKVHFSITAGTPA